MAAPAATSPDPLDALGRAILAYANYRYISLLALGLLCMLTLIRAYRRGGSPDVLDLARGAAALLSLFSGITFGVIFMMTKPPAIKELSEDSLAYASLIVLIFSSWIGMREIYELFLKKK